MLFYILPIGILFFLFQLLLNEENYAIKPLYYSYIFFLLLEKQISNQQANHLTESLMSKRIMNNFFIVTHEMTWQPSFACSYTSHFPQSSITYNSSFKCSHAKISSPFIDHDLILNLLSITSFYGWKCHGELFNITNENLTNKEN